MPSPDNRWKQRLSNFQQAFTQLSLAVSLASTREAFQNGLIQNGEVWMEMIKSRNQTSHTYNQEVASEIVESVISVYFLEFQNLLNKMTELSQK